MNKAEELKLKADRKQYTKNYKRAKLCRGCKFLHIGRRVDHNHCDCRFGDNHWQDRRVNGYHNRPNTYDHRIDCTDKQEQL